MRPFPPLTRSHRKAELAVRHPQRTMPPASGQDGKAAASLALADDTFVGGGGPRFWGVDLTGKQQLNYAQDLLQVDTKRIPRLGRAHSRRQFKVPRPASKSSNFRPTPSSKPVQIRISSQADVASDREPEDIDTRALARKIEDIYHAVPRAARYTTTGTRKRDVSWRSTRIAQILRRN